VDRNSSALHWKTAGQIMTKSFEDNKFDYVLRENKLRFNMENCLSLGFLQVENIS